MGAAAGPVDRSGLGAYGTILSSQGVAAGDTFKIASLDAAAQRGRVAAVQTGCGGARLA
jgi:hypothetical protein